MNGFNQQIHKLELHYVFKVGDISHAFDAITGTGAKTLF